MGCLVSKGSWRVGRLLWAVLLAITFATAPVAVTDAHAKAVGITDMRTWSSPESTRLVFDLTGAPTYRVKRSNDPPELVVEIKGGKPRTDQLSWDPRDPRVRSVTMEATNRGTRITIRLTQASQYKHFALTPYGDKKHHRIVVDVLGRVGKARAPRKPPPTPAAISRDRGVGGPFVVVIDPGHGGEDPGAIGRYQKTREKDVVLKIARYLKKELDQVPGIRAHLTRGSDYFISLGGRVRKANQLDGDLFVSIHADVSRNLRTRGTHIYTLAPRTSQDRRAIRVARMENSSDFVGGVQTAARLPVIFDSNGSPNNLVESRILSQLALDRFQDINRDGREGRRSEARFWVLKGKRPSILVETGFLNNKQDERSLRTDAFQRNLARRLALAVVDYYESRLEPSPFIYKVRRGDTLGEIAGRYGVPLRALAKANGIGDASRLGVGTKLVIPTRGTPAPIARASSKAVAKPVVAKAASKPVTLARPTALSPSPMPETAVSHTVRRGENPTRIAARYSVRLDDLLRANGLTKRSTLGIGQKLRVPSPRAGDRLHVVARGETLSGLAQRYGMSLSALARVNDLGTRSRLRRGQRLLVPGGPTAMVRRVYVVKRDETLSGLAQRFGVTLKELSRANGLSVRSQLLRGQRLVIPERAENDIPRVHVIRQGDSLSRIARRYHVSVDSLRLTNKLRNSDRILVGERLVIPD